MELDENVDADMMDEDTTEDMMVDESTESDDEDDESDSEDDESDHEDDESDHEDVESDHGNRESDNDSQLTSTGPSHEHLRELLMAPQKAAVMSGLRQIAGLAKQDVASKLSPEIIRIFRVFDALQDGDIQEKAAWILIDISGGTREQGRTMISAGAIPLIVEMLRNRVDWMSPTQIRLIWCLMNLASDGEEFQKVLIAHGVTEILTEIVAKVPASHFLLISISTLSALQAEIPWDLACKCLPDVLRFIQWSNNKDELDDAFRSLNYILRLFLRQQLPIPKSVMDKVPDLIKYMSHPGRYVRTSSNDVLNTIASGSDEEAQVLLDSNILDVLAELLDDSNMRAQACALISKFTAGNARQVACVMENGIIPKLINIITNFDIDLETLRDASWAVANALDGRRSPEQFRSLVLRGTIEPLCKMLASHNGCFVSKGDEGCLQIKTTQRLLRCLDQATIHLPSLQGPDFAHISTLITWVEEIFAKKGYSDYQRESKLCNE